MKLKRILASILAMCIVLSTMGTVAFAENVTVATVNGVAYADLQEAIAAAAPNGTVEIEADVTVDTWVMFAQNLTIGTGQLITLNMNGLTINGNNHSITIGSVESASNGGHLFSGATNLNINDLTLNQPEGLGGISLVSGEIKNVTFNGGNGVFPGDGDIVIDGCTFQTDAYCIYYEEARNNLAVTNNTFAIGSDETVIFLRGNETFTGNTVTSGEKVRVVSGSPTVSGNTFSENVILKVYNAAAATIENNTIENIEIDDVNAEVNSKFADNTLSAEAETVLKDAGVIEESAPTVTYVAFIGEQGYETVQAAIDAVQNGETIVLAADCAETVHINKSGVAFTIDGATKTYTGKIEINIGQSVTIKNINFVHEDDAALDFIANVGSPTGKNYNTTMTVEDCTFTGNGKDNVVAVRTIHPTAITIKNCTGTGLHSFLQNTGGQKVEVKNVTITESKGGLAVGTTPSVTVRGCNITTRTYGIRLDATLDANVTLNGNTVNAYTPVSVRKATAANYQLTFSGSASNYTATNADGIWCAICATEYEAGVALNEPTGNVKITWNTDVLDESKVYGAYEWPIDVIFSDGYTKGFDSLASAMSFGYSGGTLEKIVVHEDITESMTSLSGNITTDNPDGVTIKNTIVDEWIYCSEDFTIGEGVTYDASGYASGLFVYAKNAVINGTVVTDCYYQRYADTKLTINEPGSMTVHSETFILRYTDGDADAGIYIVGDNNDETIGLDASVIYFYQGMINAKDADIKVGTYWQTNDTDGAGSANLALDNSNMTVTVNEHNMKATGNSTVTLTNGSTIDVAGGYEGVNPTLDKTSSITKGEETLYPVAPKGENSPAYTKEVDGYVRVWGQSENTNAAESYVLKLYSNDTLIATTVLNNVGNIIDGSQDSVTWNFFYPESNDAYWTTTWEAGHPNSAAQPTKVELYIDGTLVDTTDAKMSGADDLNPVVWKELGGVEYIVTGLSGTGTQEDPYLINNLAELKFFRDSVNAGNNYSGKFVKLAADIDLENNAWTPIGTSANLFKGTFDGGEHTISNLKCVLDTETTQRAALFGEVSQATIKNVKVDNVEAAGLARVAAIVGAATNSTIDNCHVTGDIKLCGYQYVGAIVGKAYATITNCSVAGAEENYADLTVPTGDSYGKMYSGGIAGWLGEGTTSIKNSSVTYMNITTDGNVGAISGLAHYGNTIENCTAEYVNITANSENQRPGTVGIIAGGCAGTEASPSIFKNNTYSNVVATDGGEAVTSLYGTDPMGNGTPAVTNYVAKVGSTMYETLAEALTDAKDGDTIVIIAEGAYTLPSVSKKITIEGYDQAKVVFNFVGNWDQSLAGVTDITFKNLTINKTGAGHSGFFHSTKETYDNCIINGEWYTYATDAVFTECTFNQTSKDAYNLWTYGSSRVTLDQCTLNSAGKSVLLYNEGTVKATELTVIDTDFIASEAVKDKAAIEIDTSLMSGESKVVIDELTTATGFAAGSVSGNTLWNDKKDQTNIEVHVGNAKVWPIAAVAKIGEVEYESLDAALAAAKDGETVELIWAEGDAPIAMNGAVYGKSVTITGTATVDWSKGFLFVGRGGEGNGTVIFDNANLTSASDQASTGIHVSGREKDTTNKYDGTLIINNSTIELDYLINKGTITLDNSTLTVKNGFAVGGRPASETESGADATATMTLNNGSKVVVHNHNGMGLGYEAIGVMNVNSGSTFECTQDFLVAPKGTMNVNGGTVKIVGTLTNKGTLKSTGDVYGTITKAADSAVIEISGGTYTQDVSDWCADGYVAIKELTNGYYVVGETPTATVNNLGAMTIPSGDYMSLGGGSTSEDMELNFVMQFLADQDAEDMKTSPYADWYGDFVITFTGIENDSFIADGCYLAGYYGDFGWVKVPVDGMEVENGVRYPVMLGYGAGQKYDYICESVKDFRCAMYLTPEILAANPNLKVNLELSVVDNSAGSDAATEALMEGKEGTFYKTGSTEYVAEDFVQSVAQIGEVKYGTLTEALAAATDGDTIQLFAVTISEGTVKMPAELKNVTIKGAENHASIIKDTMITSADGETLVYEGITIDGIVFENSNIYIKGWRSGTESYKNWTVTNCKFNNLNNATNTAAIHFNVEENAAVDGLVYENNVVDTTSGSEVAALLAGVTGEASIKGNTIKNTAGNSLTIYVYGDANVVVEDNKLSTWGTSGSGRAIRAIVGSAESKLTVKNNVMSCENAPEQFVKVTGADIASAVSVNENYWNGNSPIVDGILDIAGEYVDNYYSDAELQNLVSIAYAAEIDGVKYATLAKAVEAAEDGDTITLLADIELTSSVVISGKTLTLDLGEHTIYDKSTSVLTSSDGIWGLIELKDNANLTVCGNGTIDCNYVNVANGWTGMAYCFNVDKTSELTVNSGSFTNGNGGIQTRGKVTVNNGTFVSHNGGTCIMATGSDANVTVNDGIFKDSVEDDDVYTGSGAVWSGFGATVNINGGTYDFAADPEHNNIVWTLFPAQNAIAGYGENANMAITGGTFVNFNPETDAVIDWSASDGFTFGSVVAEGYEVKENADGTYGVVETKLVAGTSATLDSSLALNFYLNASALTGTGYEAVIEHTKATGNVVTTAIPEADWITSGTYKIVCYTGIAAKEMADNIKITVRDAEGNQVQDAFETSLRQYALETLENYQDQPKWLTALTDMLNYGAAAQIIFNYNTDDLASKGAEAYQQYASKEYTLSKDGCDLPSTFVAGTTLTLEDMIKLNVYFKDVTDGMKATYSFTTHGGTYVEKTVAYDSFVNAWGYYGVAVDDVAIADAATLVTVTLYNSDNTVVGTAKYSVNAYLKDMIDKGNQDAIYPALAKFAASAKAAFAK